MVEKIFQGKKYKVKNTRLKVFDMFRGCLLLGIFTALIPTEIGVGSSSFTAAKLHGGDKMSSSVVFKRQLISDNLFNNPKDQNNQENNGVFGRSNIDFPALAKIPATNFNCRQMKNSNSGYYADVETGCQVFHVCDGGTKTSFLCPNGTIFRQSHLTCDWWFKVDCAKSPDHYEESVKWLRKDRNLHKQKVMKSEEKVPSISSPAPFGWKHAISAAIFARNQYPAATYSPIRVKTTPRDETPEDFGKDENQILSESASFAANAEGKYNLIYSVDNGQKDGKAKIAEFPPPQRDYTKSLLGTTKFISESWNPAPSPLSKTSVPYYTNYASTRVTDENPKMGIVENIHITTTLKPNRYEENHSYFEGNSITLADEDLNQKYITSKDLPEWQQTKTTTKSPTTVPSNAGGTALPSVLLTDHTKTVYGTLFPMVLNGNENIHVDVNYSDSSIEMEHNHNAKGPTIQPSLRELAQVFSQALSAYLEDPFKFRKILAEVRPTEPPAKIDENLKAVNEEVLAFSEDVNPTMTSATDGDDTSTYSPFAEQVNDFVADERAVESYNPKSDAKDKFYSSYSFGNGGEDMTTETEAYYTTLPTTATTATVSNDFTGNSFDHEDKLVAADTLSFLAKDNMKYHRYTEAKAQNHIVVLPTKGDDAFSLDATFGRGSRNYLANTSPYSSSEVSSTKSFNSTEMPTIPSPSPSFAQYPTIITERPDLRFRLPRPQPSFHHMIREVNANQTLRRQLILLLVNDPNTGKTSELTKRKLLNALLKPDRNRKKLHEYDSMELGETKVTVTSAMPEVRSLSPIEKIKSTPVPTDFEQDARAIELLKSLYILASGWN